MKILLRLVACAAMFIGLTGFSDSTGYYTLDIPEGWAFYKKIQDSYTVYSPNGDPRRGNITIARTSQPQGSTLQQEAEFLAKTAGEPLILQEKVAVAGRDCLHATYASDTNSGARNFTHLLVCDVVNTPYPKATGVFNVSVSGVPGASWGINYEAIFWSVVRSIKFTKP